jgi:hypothetical protein
VNWRSGFGLPVPDNAVLALFVSGNVLVAGGYFERIGDLDVPGLAAWDGLRWSKLGDFPGEYVTDLAPYPGGFVAIGGQGIGATVWHWTGATWETWTESSGYPFIEALAVEGTSVAIATVTSTDTGERSRVELHTPNGWTTLGGDFDERVLALCWYAGSLYAAGMFEQVGGVETPRIARWDGAAWQPLAQSIPHNLHGQDWVRSLAVYRGELVAAGSIGYNLDPSQIQFFTRWNGSRWAPLGSDGPGDPNLYRLRVVGNDLYALGTYSGHAMARWDGSAWHLNEESLQVFVDDVALFQGDLHAGGSLSRNGDGPASSLMRRQAGVWHTPLPGPGMRGLLGWSGPVVQAIAGTDRGIYAAGRIDFVGTPGAWRRCQGVALWDGNEWSATGLEDWPDAEPTDLVVHQGALYAIGFFESPGSGYGSAIKLTDDGWSVLSGTSNAMYNGYRGISALGDLYVAGSVDPNDAFHGIARWNGSAWAPVGGGVTKGSYVAAMAQLGSELVVAGSFTEVGGVACENVAAWSPVTGWHALGSGVEGTVSDVTARDGVLYASGNCGLGVGEPESYSGIVRWRNGKWEPLDQSPAADHLGWYRGQLVAAWHGGMATLAADGTWHRLGSGTNGLVTGMVERGPSLFVGGLFSRAGSTSAFGFAEWRDGAPVAPPIAPAITSAPNPAAGPVHLRYELPVATRARVEVFDLTGHRVDLVFDGQQPAGMQDVVWQPDAARVRAGVYFARLTVGVSNRVVRVMRIP